MQATAAVFVFVAALTFVCCENNSNGETGRVCRHDGASFNHDASVGKWASLQPNGNLFRLEIFKKTPEEVASYRKQLEGTLFDNADINWSNVKVLCEVQVTLVSFIDHKKFLIEQLNKSGHVRLIPIVNDHYFLTHEDQNITMQNVADDLVMCRNGNGIVLKRQNSADDAALSCKDFEINAIFNPDVSLGEWDIDTSDSIMFLGSKLKLAKITSDEMEQYKIELKDFLSRSGKIIDWNYVLYGEMKQENKNTTFVIECLDRVGAVKLFPVGETLVNALKVGDTRIILKACFKNVGDQLALRISERYSTTTLVYNFHTTLPSTLTSGTNDNELH